MNAEDFSSPVFVKRATYIVQEIASIPIRHTGQIDKWLGIFEMSGQRLCHGQTVVPVMVFKLIAARM
ncbi:hypothetical protein [Mesorhizobium sp. WSM2561]|uniref:hypothetical protein n=1 Tax=Mesorhizobium sp. WSM2561 TaxID=1040985 RepID=UPI0004833E37|nr:hypothetical protein [Mesorhizobium sp. WSM2561]